MNHRPDQSAQFLSDPAMYINDGKRRPDPTPEEIKRECLKLQKNWSVNERRQRIGWVPPPLTIPECKPVEPSDDYSRA
jgi:hypothetical protein